MVTVSIEIIDHSFPFLNDCNLRLLLYRDFLLRLTKHTLYYHIMHSPLYLTVYNEPTSSIKMYNINILGFQVAVLVGATHQLGHQSDPRCSLPLSACLCFPPSFIDLVRSFHEAMQSVALVNPLSRKCQVRHINKMGYFL